MEWNGLEQITFYGSDFAGDLCNVNKFIPSEMARNCNENDGDNNKNPASILANLKSTLKPVSTN